MVNGRGSIPVTPSREWVPVTRPQIPLPPVRPTIPLAPIVGVPSVRQWVPVNPVPPKPLHRDNPVFTESLKLIRCCPSHCCGDAVSWMDEVAPIVTVFNERTKQSYVCSPNGDVLNGEVQIHIWP